MCFTDAWMEEISDLKDEILDLKDEIWAEVCKVEIAIQDDCILDAIRALDRIKELCE